MKGTMHVVQVHCEAYTPRVYTRSFKEVQSLGTLS